ncbi:MAG TPA: FkbM family methyltransferase [Allosphingosinicella sp.]|jgi:FkbM family methyltransferase
MTLPAGTERPSSDALAEPPATASAPDGSSGLTLPNGLRLCLGSRQMIPAANYVVEEVFVERQYARDGFAIGETDTVVDVGANMGIFALWAAPQAPRGRILSIEPIPELADCLDASLRENSISNVSVVRNALGRPGAKIELCYYPGFNIISHQSDFRRPAYARAKMYLKNFRTWSRPARVEARCVSLGGLLDDRGVERVNFLKIDCEGGEYEVMRGMRPQDWRRIDQLVVEFHEYRKDQDHTEIVRILEGNGFEVAIEKDPVTYRLMRFGTIWAKRRRPWNF